MVQLPFPTGSHSKRSGYEENAPTHHSSHNSALRPIRLIFRVLVSNRTGSDTTSSYENSNRAVLLLVNMN